MSTPSPSSSAEATPTEQAVEPEAQVATILLRFDRLELADARGTVLETLTLDDETAAVVETLTGIFEAEPAITDYPASNHFPAARAYDWGGFRLVDGLEVEGGATSLSNFRIVAEGPAVNAVSITTMQGIRVGDDGPSVEALLDVAPDRMSCWGPAAEYGPTQGASVFEGEPLAYGVEVEISEETHRVRALVVPQYYGAGCV